MSDVVLGKTSPRLWTRPLRPLTRETTYGYEVIDFAESIGCPLFPWQKWLVVHIGELLEDGRPRFEKILVLVSRQQGKTTLLAILALYWLYAAPQYQDIKRILGTSTMRKSAEDAMKQTVEFALDADLDHHHWRTIGKESMQVGRKLYEICASNGSAPRGLRIDRLIVDELRELNSWEFMHAAEPTMSARDHAQAFMISNQGDDSAIVLDAYRNEAITFMETGEGDERLGLFEWSAPDGSDPEDVDALRQANPSIGYIASLLDKLLRWAKSAKADPGRLPGYKTEHMCMRVHHLDPAIDPGAWANCGVEDADEHWFDGLRDRLALCVDVDPTGHHATLSAAALDGSKTRLGVLATWEGPACSRDVARDLPGWVKRVGARVVGWFPNGGAAVIAADLNFPGDKTRIEAIRGDITSACMAFSDLVTGQLILHPKDSLLDKQVSSATRHWNQDRWMFIRRGKTPVDAVYAAAGAVHLARTLPPPKPPLVIRQF